MNHVSVPTQVLDALHDITHLYRNRMREELHQHDERLTRNAMRYVLYVGYHPLCTHKELMEYLHADKAQVARTLNEIEDNGWIERVPHPEDKRSRRLQLSAQGKALFNAMRKRRAKVGETMLKGSSDEEQLQLLALLTRMREQMERDQHASQ